MRLASLTMLTYILTIATSFQVAASPVNLSTVSAPTNGLEKTFELTAQILLPPTCDRSLFFIGTADGVASLIYTAHENCQSISAGDIVRITAETESIRLGLSSIPCAKAISLLAHEELPELDAIPVSQMTPPNSARRIAVRGKITDVYRDDIDEYFGFLLLEEGGCEMEAVFRNTGNNLNDFTSLIGAEVTATGIVDPKDLSVAKNRSYHFLRMYVGSPDTLRILTPPPKDHSGIPDLAELWPNPPKTIASLPSVRATGYILAIWHGNRLLLRDKAERVFKAELSDNAPPKLGDTVEMTGIPETDLFDINLLRACWRPTEPFQPPSTTNCIPVEIAALFTGKHGTRRINTGLRGKAITVRGIVKAVTTDEKGFPRLILANDPHILTVESGPLTTTFSHLGEGDYVEVTGICVIDSESYGPRPIYPRVRSIFLVARNPDDIRILSRPSWWTPVKLLFVIGLLVTILICISLWNHSLRRLAEHRGRMIAREEIKRAESELKVFERTRLAVELHDSVAQNLTGVSMEIRAAKRAKTEDASRLDEHLDMAAATLDSCRTELRNCIWDLRNLALDETTVDEALRRTLTPHLGDAKLALRFNVAREKFTDNTIHIVLRVIRELVINAVRHGHATEIKVAGCIEGKRLLFSVSDNGIGFDPTIAPGMEQGHFGLEGIRDRIALFDGSLLINSQHTKGTKATISLNLPDSNENFCT